MIIILLVDFSHIPVLTSFIQQMDGRIYDQLIHLNWYNQKSFPHVVIVDIDESSVQKEGRWPWPRDKLAQLITKLKQAGVVTIGMDIVMSEAEINYASGLKDKIQQISPQIFKNSQQLLDTLDKLAPKIDNDQVFSQTLREHNVVLSFLFQHDPQIKKGALPQPLSYISNEPINWSKIRLHQFNGYNGSLDLFVNAANQAGFVTNLPDSDGTVRHSILLAIYNGKIYSSLALQVAMNYLLSKNVTLNFQHQSLYGIQLDGLFIPINSQGQVLIPFWGQPGTLDYYSATDIMHDKLNTKELEGSIAILGSSMALLADIHQSPVAVLFPGVEMVGNIVQGIVGQQLISEFAWHTAQGALCLIFLGLVYSLIFPFLSVAGKFWMTLLSILFILGATFSLFVFRSLYFPSALLLAFVLAQSMVDYIWSYILERQQKMKISQLFGQYVPKEYVEELIDSSKKYSMEGQTRNMTALFADIRNFTGISENLDAAGVKNLLNTFFTPITEIIFSHRGTIDKYVGDMIMAFWGAPMEDKDHAYNALIASLAIFKQLPAVNAKMIENKLPSVKIGVGLASGLMNVGDMGSEFRRAYTVLGDTVNLASRLQDLTKFYQVDILVNEATRMGQDTFLWRAVDRVSVKGRKSSLTIYQPLGILTEASSDLLRELEEYHKALADYYAKNWPSAEQRFSGLNIKYPSVYLYTMYLERLLSFKGMPPADDWDGVYIHLHK